MQNFKKINSAVLKNNFTKMDRDVFIQNVKLLKNEYLQLKPNLFNHNYESKLWSLYKFCTLLYYKKWCKIN
jgi:hypothetical protein